MIRWLGILLIASGIVGGGMIYNSSSQDELLRFEGFLKLARMIRSRIECFRQPLSAIYADFSDEALTRCHFLSELQESGDFSLALTKMKDHLGLRPSLLALLSDFGQELGRSNAEEQVRHCERCIADMEKALDVLRRQLPDKTRLTKTLSLCFAAMAVILLI